MFELNDKLEIQEERVEGSKAFVIDNFYKNPDALVDYLKSIHAPLHKPGEAGSLNQIAFEDRRHQFHDPRVQEPQRFLRFLISQEPSFPTEVLTNLTRFLNKNQNDYENHIWWPHLDKGYNGIVYLNKDDEECGTNLYRILNRYDIKPEMSEHGDSWRKKEHYSVIKSFKPKYNRLVLFDGRKFPHAMNICSDRYFGEEFRINQVFFFDEENSLRYN